MTGKPPTILEYMKLLRFARDLTHAQHHILTTMLPYATGATMADIRPGNAAIIEATGVDGKTLREATAVFEGFGYLCLVRKGTRRKGGNLANEYTAHIPDHIALFYAWHKGEGLARGIKWTPPKHITRLLKHPDIDPACEAFGDYGDSSLLLRILFEASKLTGTIPVSSDSEAPVDADLAGTIPEPDGNDSRDKREPLAPHQINDQITTRSLFHGHSAERPRLKSSILDMIQELGEAEPITEHHDNLKSELTEALSNYSDIEEEAFTHLLDNRAWDRPSKKVSDRYEAGVWLNKIVNTAATGVQS